MATGRSIQLARQVGEYLAAAELGRRNWIATTFTGSVPGFDILAVNIDGRILEVQVKAIRSASWQLNAGQFLDIEIVDGIQRIKGPKVIRTARRVCIFIELREYGKDVFYLCDLPQLQKLISSSYKEGARPKNPESFHFALHPKTLARFKDNWNVLDH
jgi:hypothetical protein